MVKMGSWFNEYEIPGKKVTRKEVNLIVISFSFSSFVCD